MEERTTIDEKKTLEMLPEKSASIFYFVLVTLITDFFI